MISRRLTKEAILKRLGVCNSGSIFEVIVSTCDTNGVANAAPMGITFLGTVENPNVGEIFIKPFKSTTTYFNLASQREAVINVTSDPFLFYETALKRRTAERESKNYFAAAKAVKPPRVKGCDAYIEVSVTKVEDATGQEKDRGEINCQIKLVQLVKPGARLYSRAPFLLIEAIIHATRVIELQSRGRLNEADRLVELIVQYVDLVRRVSPSSRYKDLAERIAEVASAKGDFKKASI